MTDAALGRAGRRGSVSEAVEKVLDSCFSVLNRRTLLVGERNLDEHPLEVGPRLEAAAVGVEWPNGEPQLGCIRNQAAAWGWRATTFQWGVDIAA